MSEDKGGRELTRRGPDDLDTTDSPLTPVEGEGRDVERFSSGPRAHSAGLTEERSAQIVRQSANARNVTFLALLLIAVFIPVYWFYESGVPALGAEGRMAAEATRQLGGALPELPLVARPGTPDDPRVIELTLTGALEIVGDAGSTVEAIAVASGETVRFELENTAGFPHNFVIGSAQDLAAGLTESEAASVPPWSTGTRSLDWTVPSGERFQFGCTIPGHYQPMHGDFVIQTR